MFLYFLRQWLELENLRKRHIEELKTCMQILKSDDLLPTILYEALSPISSSSKLILIILLMFNVLILFIFLGKKLASETNENSRSTSPTIDNGMMQFTPTGLYFLPESVKLLSPSLAESHHHSTNN